MMTPPQVARLLGVSDDKIRHWIRTGELKATDVVLRRLSRPRWRVAQADLDAFIQARQPEPPLVPQRAQRAQSAGPDYVSRILAGHYWRTTSDKRGR
jgi:excisionase family DNA binding protein